LALDLLDNFKWETVLMKMMSVIAVSPKEGAVDEITDLIVDSRKDGVEGLDTYNIVHTHEDQLLVVNEWASMDAFMDYVNGPHNMIELIEHLCERFDEENVCKAYSGAIRHQEKAN
jgi:quinol monooxygenase YgiN